MALRFLEIDEFLNALDIFYIYAFRDPLLQAPNKDIETLRKKTHPECVSPSCKKE